MLIEQIRRKVAEDRFELSEHAVKQAGVRRIAVREIREALGRGEVIEDYPDDKYGPSCLVFGATDGGRRLHVQCSHPSRPVLKIITLYEPDPELWIDHRQRRR